LLPLMLALMPCCLRRRFRHAIAMAIRFRHYYAIFSYAAFRHAISLFAIADYTLMPLLHAD